MLRLALIIMAPILLAALPAAAQTSPLPYPTVAVKLSEPPSDPTFAVFRSEFATVAQRRVYAELAKLVVMRGFFWERDFGAAFAPAKAGVENLAGAIKLEGGDGQGWKMLAAFAAEPTAAPLAARPGILCAPARPRFDEAEFHALITRTGTDAADWAYPRNTLVEVRAAASATGTVVETLGPHFVRVLGNPAKPARMSWTQIATPSGRVGFVAPGLLLSLACERLCYGKDVTGRWRIAGFVGAGD
jgi:hypothetical protein